MNDLFTKPPHGTLQHPFIGWRIDKAGIEAYMPQYAKQEGFAVNPRRNGKVVHWYCIRAEKYNNHRKLLMDITNCQDATSTGEAIRIRHGQ